jgi:hypothetical protein
MAPGSKSSSIISHIQKRHTWIIDGVHNPIRAYFAKGTLETPCAEMSRCRDMNVVSHVISDRLLSSNSSWPLKSL